MYHTAVYIRALEPYLQLRFHLLLALLLQYYSGIALFIQDDVMLPPDFHQRR